jgi:peroxiredoxin
MASKSNRVNHGGVVASDHPGTQLDRPPGIPPLPVGLPVPVDDGAADHLPGALLPAVQLASTQGLVDLGALAARRLVLFVFPRIGRPDDPNPEGWDEIPGARGCTQQSCGFRDRLAEFDRADYSVAGLSAQSTEVLMEAALRLQLRYPLLSDPDLLLGSNPGLPTFEIPTETLYRRLALVVERRRIRKVFYPVFPPQDNAARVLEWMGAATD